MAWHPLSWLRRAAADRSAAYELVAGGRRSDDPADVEGAAGARVAADADAPDENEPEWKKHVRLLRAMLPYMWPKRGEGALKRNLVLAFVFLFTFKTTSLCIPFAYKHAVDSLTNRRFPFKEIVAYASLQVLQAASKEAKDNCFNLVTALTQRIISQRVLAKVCALSVRWHLMRKTGAVLKAMSRGSASLSDFVRFISQQLVPIVVETVVVCIIFLTLFRYEFSCVVVVVIISYITFTVKVTNWRNEHRRVQTKCVTHMFWPAHTRVFIARGLTDAHTHAQNPKARRCVSAEGDGCAAKL